MPGEESFLSHVDLAIHRRIGSLGRIAVEHRHAGDSLILEIVHVSDLLTDEKVHQPILIDIDDLGDTEGPDADTLVIGDRSLELYGIPGTCCVFQKVQRTVEFADDQVHITITVQIPAGRCKAEDKILPECTQSW